MKKLTRTIPFNPGDNDPGKTYPDVIVTEILFDLDEGRAMVKFEIGEVQPDGSWVKGPGSTPTKKTFELSTKPALAQQVDQLAERALQEAINQGLYSGTIEDS